MEIEELKEYQREYFKAKVKEYYEANKEKIDQYRKEFYDQHKTEYKLKRKKYKHDWYLKNKHKTMDKKQDPKMKTSVRISETAQQILRKIKDEQFKSEGYWMPYTKIIEILGLKKLQEMGVNTDMLNKNNENE